ncbi:hypothetical protein ES703_119780 [subsurface metagenome]
MSRIEEKDGTSQAVLYAFDFKTFKRTAFINVNNKLIHADLSGKPFEPLMCFPFYENISNPDRKIEDTILACQWIGPEEITMENLPGLIKAMPHVDPKTINFIVKGNKNKQGEPIYWPEIGYILVYASLQENWETVIKDDKFYIRKRPDQDPTGFPDGYNPHGGTKKKSIKRGEPGFYKEWSGSGPGYPDEKEIQHQEPKPRKKEPGPKTKAKVIHFPKYPTPPKKIWDWCKDHYAWGEWKRILRALHKYSWYRKRNEDKYYHGKSERKNRQYIRGQVWLAKKIEVNRHTIKEWFKRFEHDGIIYVCQRGYIDRGASIIELAFTEAHRRMNKRKTGER